MGKYQPLFQFLQKRAGGRVTLSFQEVEAILGAELPKSASTYPAWWANENYPGSQHVQAHAWLEAGWTVSSDIAAKRLTFKKTGT